MKLKEKRILIAVGGTGGHIFPALSVAEKLVSLDPNLRVLFVGGGLAKNSYFDQKAFPFREVASATFSGKNPFKFLSASQRILKGISESRRIFNEFNPNLILGFGSYYTLPTLIAAKTKGIPFVLHEANSIPGKVNRFLSKWAVINGVHFPNSATYLKGKTVEVGMPLRTGYSLKQLSKANARDYFRLHHTRPTILVFGGSQGAFIMNNEQCNSEEAKFLGVNGGDVVVLCFWQVAQLLHAIARTFAIQLS